jgi:hypothetical protein
MEIIRELLAKPDPSVRQRPLKNRKKQGFLNEIPVF